jgi:hypothetical protein
MVDEAERLFSEVQQIKSQYVAEVGSGRRAWPRAIKDRIARLDTLGVPAKAIAQKSGISYETIIIWRHKLRKAPAQNAFHELSVGSNVRLPSISKSATVTATKNEMCPASPLRLTTPGGFVIEGLTAETLLALLERLNGGQTHAS